MLCFLGENWKMDEVLDFSDHDQVSRNSSKESIFICMFFRWSQRQAERATEPAEAPC
jgi:hypothetical protein